MIAARAFSGCPQTRPVLLNASRGLHANQRCFVDIEPVHHVMDARFLVFDPAGHAPPHAIPLVFAGTFAIARAQGPDGDHRSV
jgi:hypothetical protein